MRHLAPGTAPDLPPTHRLSSIKLLVVVRLLHTLFTRGHPDTNGHGEKWQGAKEWGVGCPQAWHGGKYVLLMWCPDMMDLWTYDSNCRGFSWNMRAASGLRGSSGLGSCTRRE